MKQQEGIDVAKALKRTLLQRNIPVRQVLLYGSLAKNNAHQKSDIDIAVICEPFKPTRLEENVEVARAREDVDLRIETICLHPEDLENKYSTIAQEIMRHGIAV